MASSTKDDTTRHLLAATTGFDALFANDLQKARDIFGTNESPFHLLGSGVCAFLEAALGMEVMLSVFVVASLPNHCWLMTARTDGLSNEDSSRVGGWC